MRPTAILKISFFVSVFTERANVAPIMNPLFVPSKPTISIDLKTLIGKNFVSVKRYYCIIIVIVSYCRNRIFMEFVDTDY